MTAFIKPAPVAAPQSALHDSYTQQGTAQLRGFVFVLFFAFGGITSLNDVLIPKLKALFTLSYGEVMLVQSAFFAAYFVISLPAAALVRKVGFLRAAVIGLATMACGCLLFVPASIVGHFEVFLIALFVLASGITTVQVVANPLISLLGDPAGASSRLTFAQAFNSLGTTIFPYVGALLILASLGGLNMATLSGGELIEFRAHETHVIAYAYIGIAAALTVLAGLVWLRRGLLRETPANPTSIVKAFKLLSNRRFSLGALCIFLYVGGEVTIGSLIVSYLSQASTLGLSAELAGRHVPLYWGGAMVGRFVGAYLLRKLSPANVLSGAALAVIVLLVVAIHGSGSTAGYALLAVGLFNSVMFPVIFSLASDGLGHRAADGSGIICMAIVGGAVVPVVTGHAADAVGLNAALWVPVVCYAVILGFARFTARDGRLLGNFS